MPPYRLGFKRSRSAAVTNAKRRRINVAAGGRRMVYARTRNFYGPFRTGGFYGSSVRSPAEKKVIDTAQTTTAVNTTGSVTLINGVATGTDFTDRIGRRVNITAIQLRGLLNNDITVSGGPANNLCRIMLVEDMQINGGAAPAITDILSAATSTAFINMNNRERFKVHYDGQFEFGPMSTGAGTNWSPCPGAHSINVYRKVNIPMTFEGTAATIGSISSGALYVVTVGTTAAGGTDCNFTWSARCRFVDA